MIRSHTKLEDPSKTTENATSSPSVVTEESDLSHPGMDATETQPSRGIDPSKKRKVDEYDDSVPTSSSSCAGSAMEPSHGKGKKSAEQKRSRKKSKKKAKDEGKKHMRG
jgi:hypothetical protein